MTCAPRAPVRRLAALPPVGRRPAAVLRPTPRSAAALFAVALAWTPAAAAGERQERIGTALSHAMPAGVLAVELARGDTVGSLQFATAFTAAMLATTALKHTVSADRPDGGGDDAFPSGHAARAFSAAAYVHRRYSLQQAWPMYALASFVGYSRVDADRHRWRDVLGSVALSVGTAWWLVEPAGGRLEVALRRDGVAVSWRLPLD